MKEILQENDTNNNNYRSNYLQYQYNYDTLNENYFCNNNNNNTINNNKNNGLISCQSMLTNTVPITTTTTETIPIQEVTEIHQHKLVHDNNNDRINCEMIQLTKLPINLDESLHNDTVVNKQLNAKEEQIVDNIPENDVNVNEIRTKCNDENDNDRQTVETKNDNNKLKPFRCDDCGKGFSQLRNYKYHR